MTAITGKVGVNKRPGELGIHSMDAFDMIVPNLAEAADFYTAFGLDVREDGDRLALYTFGSGQRWANLSEGSKKRLSHLSFGVFEEDFEPMKRHVEASGITLLDAPPGFESNALWFRDPHGTLIEVKVAEKSSPAEKSAFTMASKPAGTAASPQRSKAAAVRPTRLAHVLLFTPSVPESLAFYSRILGLRLSDRSGDGICFLHGIHGSDHHMVAFAKSDAPGLHHCSWDVPDIDEIGRGAMQMADQGHTRGWGLGRHVLGSNFFHYVRDPWGSYSEYSADIDYVPFDHDWEAGDFPPEDSFYLWGPQTPDDFTHNYEAEATRAP